MGRISNKPTVQLIIDDVGWVHGADESHMGKPYRNGVSRFHTIEDYQPIARIGKHLGIKPVIAMVLGDWDRDNILRDIPGATWMGSSWDNSELIKNFGDQLDEIVEFLNHNQDYLEIGMHGLQHEYWENGKMSRAQFYDEAGRMRTPSVVEAHVDAFFRIMDRNGLKAEVKNFVPPAFCYECYDNGMTKILKSYGFKYIQTQFKQMRNAPDAIIFEEDGMLYIDRPDDELDWCETDVYPVKRITHPTYGLHWSNVMCKNPQNNPVLAQQWINALENQVNEDHIILAKDSDDFANQLRRS